MRAVSLPALGLAGTAIVMVGVDIGRRVLATNDEARFPVLAQDILGRGAWLVPQLDGQPYLNKPPLMAWLIAIVSWPVGGVSQLTAAVPPALAAVGAALVVYVIGRDLFDRDAGYGAALVALTSQGFVEFSRVPVPDMLMTLAMTTSLWMLVRLVREPRGAWWVGFYGFAAAAFWAKGPAGLLPLAVALAWTLAGRTSAWRELRLAPGAIVVAVLIAPYWIGGLTASAAGVRRAVVTDQLAWYVPAAISPRVLLEPFGHALGILVPWIVVVPIALIAALRSQRAAIEERRGLALLVAWAAVVFVLIAISREQRFRYYLPLVPPVSLLVGWWVSRMAAHRRRVRQLFAGGCVVAGLGLLLAYHLAMSRQNAAYDYPRLVTALDAAAGHARLVTWDVYALPVAFYGGRSVTSVESEGELMRALDGPPPGVAIVRDDALRRVGAGAGLTVVMRDRLGGRPVSVVSRATR